jgi:hypothetical protein
MIDIEPVISDQERKLYQKLDEQTEKLRFAKDNYLASEYDSDSAIDLADAYVAWSNTLDKVARIQAEQVVAHHRFLGPMTADCGEE